MEGWFWDDVTAALAADRGQAFISDSLESWRVAKNPTKSELYVVMMMMMMMMMVHQCPSLTVSLL